MPGPSENVLEPYARHIGTGAMLFVNGDGSWSIGPTTSALTKVSFGNFATVGDSTFGWSAMAVESDGKGGWRLFARNDDDEDMVAEVAVDSAGRIDPASVAVLGAAQMHGTEERLHVDLNDSGGFGAGPVLLQGGAVNLYASELGHYQVGDSPASVKTLTLGGQPVDDQLLPAGWEIVELALASGGGWLVYAQSPDGAIFEARFDASGAYAAGAAVGGANLDALEQSLGVDIDGDNDLPTPDGWTGMLQSELIRTSVVSGLDLGTKTPTMTPTKTAAAAPLDGAVAPPTGTMTHAELVGMLQNLIKAHKDAGNTPITGPEVTDLQALAARGKAVFAGNGASADYLSYAFSKLVEGSDANRFFNGGAAERSELGSLGAGSSVTVLERLVQKWLLGGDMPSARTAGDTATGNAQAVSPSYAKSSGTLFVEGIAISDVAQGTAGDCYLIAVMGGLAGTKPATIEAMFVENAPVDGVRSWGVRFFDAGGKAHWVTVNDQLPVTEAAGTRLAYAGPADKGLNGEIWVPLLEKAYAQANMLNILPRGERNGQNSIGAIEGGFGDPLAQLVGGKITAYNEPGDGYGNNSYLTAKNVDRTDPVAKAQLETDLKAAINAGKLVWIGVSKTATDSFNNKLLVASHAHYAIDANPSDPNNGDVMVYNPWGLQALPSPAGPAPGEWLSPVNYTLAQLVGIEGLDFMVLDGPG